MFFRYLLVISIVLSFCAQSSPNVLRDDAVVDDVSSEISADKVSSDTPKELVLFPDSKTPLETCRSENEELLQRLERLESVFNVSQFNPDLDDVSLMELMYLSVKQKVLNSVPSTDEFCKFDYITAKCAPSCYCEFKPKLGDYTPSRMCRLIPNENIDRTCDHLKRQTPWIVESANFTKKMIGFVVTKMMKKIREKAPPTDNECKFNLPSMECFPRNKCALDYQFGDYNPHRACRYRLEEVDDEKNILSDSSNAMMKRELVGTK